MRYIVDYIKKNKPLFLLITTAFLFHMLIIIPSGSYFCFKNKCGLFFWGVHEHDAIWHLALSSVSFKQWPIIAPTYGKATLSGYNFLLDFFIWLLAKFKIPPIFSYFKLLPIFWFFSFTYLAIVFARKIKDSPGFVFPLLFFFYFGGSFAYFFTLYHHKTLDNSSGMLAMQAGQTLTNLQFAFSLVILLFILNLIVKNKILSLRLTTALGLLLFVQWGLKFYGGVIGFFLIVVYYLFALFKKINNLTNRWTLRLVVNLTILAVFVSASIFLFYKPISSFKTEPVFKISPFALVHSIIEEPGLFYLKDLVNARYFLASRGFSPRLLAIELFSLFLFLFFNLGTRFFGFLYFLAKLLKRKANQLDLTIMSTIIFSICLTVLLIQRGEWWNTIQFFYYAIFLSNIFTAQLIYDRLQKKNFFNLILVGSLILLTLPQNIDLIRGYNFLKPSTYLPKEEWQALNFLSKQPSGIVYTSLINQNQQNQLIQKLTPPYPLWSVVDSAYVSAFSGKQTYLADIHVLRITGIQYQKRLKRINNQDCKILEEVEYIYKVKKVNDDLLDKCLPVYQSNFEKIYDNNLIDVYYRKI